MAIRRSNSSEIRKGVAALLAATMVYAGVLSPAPALAQEAGGAGTVLETPVTPMELPLEVEIELSPAGSLKQAPLWKELYQLLKNPYSIVCSNPADPSTCTATGPGIQRRPGFGVGMPALKVWPSNYNFLTGQPMRLRTSDGEVSWDQPGPLFDPEEVVPTDAFSTPTALRTVIGHLVACPDNPAYQAAVIPVGFCDGPPDGSLVVYNPTGHSAIPPDGTVVATSAINSLGQLIGEDGDGITEFEAPVNEEDFFRDPTDRAGVPGGPLRRYIGRHAAEILGKALFWDMQVGSDGVQSCGSCHFHAGADNRTRNQLNPNTLGTGPNNTTIQLASAPGSFTTNVEVVASDFPFHGGAHDTTGPGDSDDVMSSMGVSRFKRFVNIPPIPGMASFGPVHMGVRPLLPDRGVDEQDPVAVMRGVRRVEPRNTPTFHGAAFNLDNFWDGRARFAFNGGSVFGASDPTPHIFINPGLAVGGNGAFEGATMGHLRPDLEDEEPEVAEQPVRIKFSSLASQAVGPPLSDFEMSFAGRNWAKIGKKLLQGNAGAIQNQGNGAPQQAGTNRENAVVPLANQLVDTTDSRLGPFSNQGGSVCTTLGRPTAAGKPGLCISYPDLIRLAFARQFWNRNNRRLNGADCDDPFDGYCLTPANGAANPNNRDQFTQMEANFSLFFALAVQAYESLTIPDHTPADQFFDRNPNAGQAVGEPGDQAVLYPTLIRDLLDDGQLNGTNSGFVRLVPDNPSTPWYDGFGPDELFGFDIFAGANLTAGLRPAQAQDPTSGRNRNPLVQNSLGQRIRVGSNPFTRSAKCMLCHLGPEQTDHSINIAHGLLKNDAEFEYPIPPAVADPTTSPVTTFADGLLPSSEPSGSSRVVTGIILAEEISEGGAQDAVEVEPRNFATFDDGAGGTPWDDRIVAQESNFAFGDQGVYNIGVRPVEDDPGRGGDDPFGFPLSLAALTLKNIGGEDFEPCDRSTDSCVMTNFDPFNIEATFEETGDGALFPGTSHDLQSINPGFERDPITPQLPEYMVPWMHGLPAGELHPQIDEMAGMVPNTVTPPNGGPGIEFAEVMFGADFHCARYDPAVFGSGPPNFGYGPPSSDDRVCPQNQSGVAGNMSYPAQGTWPVPNRVIRNGTFKAPPLRNVELTGPYFHTGSYLTLRQVVDFYFRGGDFPNANAENRDPHIVDLTMQAFSFGRTTGADLAAPVNDGVLVGTFADGLPDGAFLYDTYPDSDHPLTPEPTFASPEAALEDAKNAIVKFLIALTDPRVKLRKAPFDHPELFVPIDGQAPENTGGPGQLTAQSGVPCPVLAPAGPVCFKHIPAVGAAGSTTPFEPFLGISSTPVTGANNDHFDPNPSP